MFSKFCYSLPLEKGMLFTNNLKNTLVLCQVWMKLAPWFCRRQWKYGKKITKTTDDRYTYISIRKNLVNLNSGDLDSGEVDCQYMAEILPVWRKTPENQSGELEVMSSVCYNQTTHSACYNQTMHSASYVKVSWFNLHPMYQRRWDTHDWGR